MHSSRFGVGKLRFCGPRISGTKSVGVHCGVEFAKPVGDTDGVVDGVEFFTCKPNYGVLIPIAKVRPGVQSSLRRRTAVPSADSRADGPSISSSGQACEPPACADGDAAALAVRLACVLARGVGHTQILTPHNISSLITAQTLIAHRCPCFAHTIAGQAADADRP